MNNRIRIARGISEKRKASTEKLVKGQLFLETDTQVLYNTSTDVERELRNATPINVAGNAKLGTTIGTTDTTDRQSDHIFEENSNTVKNSTYSVISNKIKIYNAFSNLSIALDNVSLFDSDGNETTFSSPQIDSYEGIVMEGERESYFLGKTVNKFYMWRGDLHLNKINLSATKTAIFTRLKVDFGNITLNGETFIPTNNQDTKGVYTISNQGVADLQSSVSIGTNSKTYGYWFGYGTSPLNGVCNFLNTTLPSATIDSGTTLNLTLHNITFMLIYDSYTE